MDLIKRNGTIELLRFLFASGVVLVHAVADLYNFVKIIGHIGNINITFFKSGYIGVEFFFVLSGFFMAKTIYRKVSTGEKCKSIGEETVSYLWKKVKTVLPYYLPACAVMLVIFIFIGENVLNIIKRIPSLFFLQQTGAFEYSFITISWYISAMLIAMAILYPFCRKFYNTFTVLVAPLIGLLIVGVIIHYSGNLGGVTEWAGITYKSNFRAIAELALGTTCFEMSRRLSMVDFKRAWSRVLLSLVAFLGYASAFLYMNLDIDLVFSAYVLIFLCVSITITLSNTSWLSRKGLMQNRLFMYLGSISLPLYLFQNVPRYLVPMFFSHLSRGYQCILIYFSTLFLAVLMHLLVTRITLSK